VKSGYRRCPLLLAGGDRCPARRGGEVGLYAPDTGKVFLYDVNRNPDAAELAEFRSFLESHMDGGHTVTLWMR